MRAKYLILVAAFTCVSALLSSAAYGQKAATVKASVPAPSGLTLHAVTSTVSADTLRQATAPQWNQIESRRVALNRTPKLFDTDKLSELEIQTVEVRIARISGKLLLQMSWLDKTQDTAAIEAKPDTPPETRNHKALTESTNRFFDGAAVMFPSDLTPSSISPSLQMGDAQHQVTIYYWNAARGAIVMEARGRETTKRTGKTFPANAVYASGKWTVRFELPDAPNGTPMALAIWNGSQEDRDGRKYFSVWYILE